MGFLLTLNSASLYGRLKTRGGPAACGISASGFGMRLAFRPFATRAIKPPIARRSSLYDAAANSDPAATADQKNAASDALNAYIGETTQYAFATAAIFRLVAAMVGVRALAPFLDASTIKDVGQRDTFIVFDVVLSAALMAGGANGIHSVVSAFTSFFDASAQKSQNSVGP